MKSKWEDRRLWVRFQIATSIRENGPSDGRTGSVANRSGCSPVRQISSPSPACIDHPILPPATSFQISPDGRVVASVSGPVLRLADVELGRETFRFDHSATLLAVGLSASTAAVCFANTLVAYNVHAGRELVRRDLAHPAHALRFSTDGLRLWAHHANARASCFRGPRLRPTASETPSSDPPEPIAWLDHPDGLHRLWATDEGLVFRRS